MLRVSDPAFDSCMSHINILRVPKRFWQRVKMHLL